MRLLHWSSECLKQVILREQDIAILQLNMSTVWYKNDVTPFYWGKVLTKLTHFTDITA